MPPDREKNRFTARARRYANVGASVGGVAARVVGQRLTGAPAGHACQTLTHNARGHATDAGADIGVASGAGGEAVFFAVGGHVKLFVQVVAHIYKMSQLTSSANCP